MANETTTKIKADLSQLIKEFQDAQRHIRLVTSEFKASTAGMDKWTENADGLGAKIKQLNGILEAEESKLKSLESQYQLVAKEQGENSKGAQDLMIKINNQKAAVEKTRASIGYYTDKLNDLTAESKDAETATDKLRNTISQQESDLESLKAKYSNLVLEQGKSSKEAKETAKEIQKLSSELQQNKTALNEAEGAADGFDKSLDNVDDTAEKVSGGFTVMKGALADLLADGIKSAAGALKDFTFESDSAYKGFQAQTGASAEEMKNFKSEMDDLYKNNYGESLQDIGDKMAYVKQVTGEVDPSKIRELTENAIALEDTFGSDFNETIRGVNNLMQHFGIDAEEAFDLFAKGSQLGLDYTDELGDNIAEYGGNFEQAGYSAEEYFQLLANGTKNGAYNLDKVNDSINEVKNRLGDGTIEEAIDIFSDNTKTAFQNWKDGKGTMKDVIDSIVGDINNCTNEQDALNMAATAFGTMGEDANLKVVKSLTSTGDAFKDVKGSMEEVKKVKYDDVKSEFQQLGRTIQLDVIAPLAKKALPTAKEFVKWTTENLNKIIPVAEAVGVAIAAIFTVNKIATFVNSLKTLATAMGLVKVGAAGAATSTTLLGTAMAALPYVAVAAGIAAVAAAVVVYGKKQEEAMEKEYGLSKAQKQSIQDAKDLKAAYDETNKARNESMDAINSEYGHLTELKNELNGLIDSNGQVKAGYEDRANFIINQLASALGLEKDKIWEIINANGKLDESIDQVIQKKQAEAILNANEAAYTEAIQKRGDALTKYQSALDTLDSAERKYNQTKEAAGDVLETYETLLDSNIDAAVRYYQAHAQEIEANEKAKESYEKAKKGVEDAESAYVGYNATIQNYEGLSSAIISGDAGKIQVALQNMQNGFITAEIGTKESLENQVSNMQKTYEDMKAAVEAGMPGVTQEQVDQAKNMVDKATTELDKFEQNAKTATEKAGDSAAEGFKGRIPTMEEVAKYGAMAFTSGFDSKSADFYLSGENAGDQMNNGAGSKLAPLNTTGQNLSDSLNEGMGKADTKKTGQTKGEEFKSGAGSKNKDTNKQGIDLSNSLNLGLGTADTSKTGKNLGLGFANGVGGQSGSALGQGKNVATSANSGMGSVSANGTGRSMSLGFNSGISSVSTNDAGKGRANDAKSGMGSVSAYDTGNNFTQGFNNGMSLGKAAGSIWNTAWSLGKKALSALSSAIKEGSPSKETAKSGKWFVLGFTNQIADMTKVAVSAAKEMGKETIDALNDELSVDVKAPVIKDLDTSMIQVKKAVSSGAKSRGSQVTNQTNNTYNNFYQTNNSPKPLSRLEIYRQTKNQLNFAKGVT